MDLCQKTREDMIKTLKLLNGSDDDDGKIL